MRACADRFLPRHVLVPAGQTAAHQALEWAPRAASSRACRVHRAWPLTTRDASAGPAGFAQGVRNTAATSCVPSVSLEAAPSRPPAHPPHSAGLACTLHLAPRMQAEGHSAWRLLSQGRRRSTHRSPDPTRLPEATLPARSPSTAWPRPLHLCPPFPGRLQPPTAPRVPARADSPLLVNCTSGGIKAGLACPDESSQSGV